MPSATRVDLQQAAAELGVHYQTAYRWVRTGKLPADLVGGRYLVDRSDIAAVSADELAPRASATAVVAPGWGTARGNERTHSSSPVTRRPHVS